MNILKKYGYKLRPGYGSEELLLELDARDSSDSLQQDLFLILEQHGFKLNEVKELWMNDELRFIFSSCNGTISLSRDIWDIFFIMGESNNQEDILMLDVLLSKNPLFEKVIANHSDYKEPFS